MTPVNLEHYALNTTLELGQLYAGEMRMQELYLVSDEGAVEFECNCVDLVKNAIEGLG